METQNPINQITVEIRDVPNGWIVLKPLNRDPSMVGTFQPPEQILGVFTDLGDMTKWLVVHFTQQNAQADEKNSTD